MIPCFDIIFSLQIMFIFVDIKVENLAKPFLTLFGLEESEDTTVSSIIYSLMQFSTIIQVFRLIYAVNL